MDHFIPSPSAASAARDDSHSQPSPSQPARRAFRPLARGRRRSRGDRESAASPTEPTTHDRLQTADDLMREWDEAFDDEEPQPEPSDFAALEECFEEDGFSDPR
ncbi:MAG TPA: hypothetical protein VFE24_06315 [Pirellulales bacterium]|nr:hypothetical protein [Pirellulales bacterium]